MFGSQKILLLRVYCSDFAEEKSCGLFLQNKKGGVSTSPFLKGLAQEPAGGKNQ